MNIYSRILLCLCVVSAVVLCGCRKQSTPGLPTVKVCINTWPGLGPYYVAKAKGFDKEEGINLEIVMTEDTQARRRCLPGSCICRP